MLTDPRDESNRLHRLLTELCTRSFERTTRPARMRWHVDHDLVGDVARIARPQPLRVLDRHRTPGRLIWRTDPTPLSRAGNRRMNHVIHIAAIVTTSSSPTRAPKTTHGHSRRRVREGTRGRLRDPARRLHHHAELRAPALTP